MKWLSVSKGIGIAGVLLGGWWLWGSLVGPVYRFIMEEKEAFDYWFMLTMIPLMSSPGVIAVYFGAKLVRTPNERNIKWTVGAGVVFLAFLISALLDWLTPVLNSVSRSHSVTFLIATMIVIPLYIIVCRWVMKAEGMAVGHYSHYLSKGIVFIVALQFWMIGEELFERYYPKEQGRDYMPKEPWGPFVFFVPLLAAWIFYKIVMWVIEKKKEKYSIEA
ncbi:MAG: hypothetical protein JW709_08070 [Sedimentisphaerales bacterium]|nr:hypothetical protein [Sedimentisphaerales bacterium]